MVLLKCRQGGVARCKSTCMWKLKVLLLERSLASYIYTQHCTNLVEVSVCLLLASFHDGAVFLTFFPGANAKPAYNQLCLAFHRRALDSWSFSQTKSEPPLERAKSPVGTGRERQREREGGKERKYTRERKNEWEYKLCFVCVQCAQGVKGPFLLPPSSTPFGTCAYMYVYLAQKQFFQKLMACTFAVHTLWLAKHGSRKTNKEMT